MSNSEEVLVHLEAAKESLRRAAELEPNSRLAQLLAQQVEVLGNLEDIHSTLVENPAQDGDEVLLRNLESGDVFYLVDQPDMDGLVWKVDMISQNLVTTADGRQRSYHAHCHVVRGYKNGKSYGYRCIFPGHYRAIVYNKTYLN